VSNANHIDTLTTQTNAAVCSINVQCDIFDCGGASKLCKVWSDKLWYNIKT